MAFELTHPRNSETDLVGPLSVLTRLGSVLGPKIYSSVLEWNRPE
ncbi:hypothetical protein CCACVL1_03195 [Corchorus capsularis]|uniref:Uncharacterized protein n=1 Tax=Corchorus capsularis TaxID=210143 RepID=A0A1R3K1R9_COCAP|nr:hypothetical protein CCACVL1_03195 [Corchorus capsularis]